MTDRSRQRGWTSLAALACLALALLLLPGCGGGDSPSPEPAAGKRARKKKGKKKPKKPGTKPGPKPAKAAGGGDGGKPEPPTPEATAPSPGPAEEEPAPAATRALALAYPAGKRMAFQVKRTLEALRGEEERRALAVDGWAFVRVVRVADGRADVIREEPPPVREVREGQAFPRRQSKDVAFQRCDPCGAVEPLAGKVSRSLLSTMARPRFPAEPVAVGGTWTAVRDFSEGRFLFTYTLKGPAEHEGRDCLEIAVTVAPPGGDPCQTLVWTEGRGRILFDPSAGVALLSEGSFAYAEKDEGGDLTVTASYAETFGDATPMGGKERREAEAVMEAFARITGLLAKKSYAAAEKAIDAFVEETDSGVYADMVDRLRERIPDTRTFQPRGLLPRSRFDFGTKLKWKAPPGPAIVLTGTGTMKPGKARVLACVGKAAPAFWWKALVRGGDWKKVKPALEGKVVILHVWASWIPPCAAASRALEEFARDLPQDKAAVLGISIDTERKSLDAFLKQRKVTLPTVWDRDNEAVRSFGLPGAPAYLVLDARRVVRFGEVGWFGDKTLGRIDGAAKQALK